MGTKKDTYRSRLAEVAADRRFHCHGGSVLKNLEELAVALSEMSEEAYDHHVTEQNNDFSNWIGDVIGDSALARSLSKAGSRLQAHSIVQERIKWLQARA